MFSPQELQKLISGDTIELDVDDLRYVPNTDRHSFCII